MIDKIVVRRYADAFLAFARESIGQAKAFEDLKGIRDIVRDNPEFLDVFKNPEITFHQKSEFINKVLGENVSAEFKHFLYFLLEKGRIDKIVDIAEYIRVTYAYGDEVEALLKTSFPLELELIEEIKSRLENRFKKKFKLYIDLDGSLLGGVQLVIGNTVFDGSVRRRIDDLKEQLMSARVS